MASRVKMVSKGELSLHQEGAAERAEDAAEAADTQHPCDAGGAPLRRIEASRQRRHRRLRAVHNAAGDKDHHSPLAPGCWWRSPPADKNAGQQPADGHHFIGVDLVHQGAEDQHANPAAEREQGGNN